MQIQRTRVSSKDIQKTKISPSQMTSQARRHQTFLPYEHHHASGTRLQRVCLEMEKEGEEEEEAAIKVKVTVSGGAIAQDSGVADYALHQLVVLFPL